MGNLITAFIFIGTVAAILAAAVGQFVTATVSALPI